MEWRERLVQTICEARNAYFADDVEHRRDGRDPDEVIADAILATIDAAGCAIVPVEPTEEMFRAAGEEHFRYSFRMTWDTCPQETRVLIVDGVDRIYRAMIAARPK